MNYFYLDPSALVKRYHIESGSDTVDYLLDKLLSNDKKLGITSIWSIPEIIAALNRRKNEQKVSVKKFSLLVSAFLNEVSKFFTVDFNQGKIVESVSLILKHNLNSVDALHLVSIKESNEIAKLVGNSLVVVAADERLLRSAMMEGFEVLNPEVSEKNDVDKLLIM